MCLVHFYVIEQYCKEYYAKTTYFFYFGLAVTSFKICIQFSKNISVSIRWMTMVKVKVKAMNYAASHNHSFKWLVKDDILHYDTSDFSFDSTTSSSQ